MHLVNSSAGYFAPVQVGCPSIQDMKRVGSYVDNRPDAKYLSVFIILVL